MKLIAAPFLIRIRRLTRGPELSQIPFLIIDRLRTPLPIYHRITKRAAVRCADFATIEHLLISVVMTSSTRIERALLRAKLRTLVLCVTINTPDSRGRVRLDRRRYESVGVMTIGATLLHLACQ